jgi:hypothetical protein
MNGGALCNIVPAIVGVACMFVGMVADAQTSADALPGTSYASLAELPDYSGWWLATAARTTQEELANQPPPFNDEAAQARSASLAANAPVPFAYCRPREFTGQSGGFTEALELLFTPGRVTLTTERGLLRRIYTDGRPMPEDLEFTNTGTSIGHWEDETLVVETAGIDPRVYYPDRSAGGIPFGRNVVIHERIDLADENTLRFDVEIVAPDIFTAPYRSSQLYRRLSKTMANEISWCSESDRSLDPRTGKQRFDTTPPPGLPPPPSR